MIAYLILGELLAEIYVPFVRQTERLVGVHRDTVMRLARKAGEHARAAHDELVDFSSRNP